jgi:hypothetical protein
MSKGSSDIWVARYSPDGHYLWSVGKGGEGYDAVFAVTVDGAGDVYVVGYASSGIDLGGGERPNRGGFLLKLGGMNGAYAWDRSFGLVSPSSAAAIGLAAIAPDMIVTTILFTGAIDLDDGCCYSSSSSSFDSILIAYEASTGTQLWYRKLGNTGDSSIPTGLSGMPSDVIGIDNDVIASVKNAGPTGSPDLLLIRFRGEDGAYVWNKSYGVAPRDEAHVLAIQGSQLLIGGRFTGTTNLGGADLISQGSTDAFIAAYDVGDGRPIWSERFGGPGNDEAVSIAARPEQLAIGLRFTDTISIGQQPLTASPALDALEVPPNSGDVAIAWLDPASGGPVRARHFENTEGLVALAYAGSQLTGNMSFGMTMSLLGTALTALGSRDIAAFRITPDRLP